MSVQKVDIGALNRDVFGTVMRPFIDAFNIDDGGGLDCDLKVFGDEGSSSFFWYDHSEDKVFIQRTTEETSPGRLVYIQVLGSAMAVGQNIQGMQIRARATGTGTIAGGTDGIEVKAGLNSDSDTGTIAGARAIIANIDAKKGTITIARGVEMQVDLAVGGEITTLHGFRASLNNSGTVGTSMAFIVETANKSYNWDTGLYIGDGQADVGVFIGDATTGIVLDGTITTGLSMLGGVVTGILMDAVTTAAITAACTLTGTTNRNFIALTITDDSTIASEYSRGLYINWTSTGDRTGSGEINGIGIDFSVGGNAPYVYGMAIYAAHSGNPTVGFFAAHSIYIEDMGSNLSSFAGIDIGTNIGTNTPSSMCTFLRLRNHASSKAITSTFHIQSNNNQPHSTYLFDFQGQPSEPIVADASSVPGNATYKIKCRYHETTFYLIGVADF